jgi:hypothetical protein
MQTQKNSYQMPSPNFWLTSAPQIGEEGLSPLLLSAAALQLDHNSEYQLRFTKYEPLQQAQKPSLLSVSANSMLVLLQIPSVQATRTQSRSNEIVSRTLLSPEVAKSTLRRTLSIYRLDPAVQIRPVAVLAPERCLTRVAASVPESHPTLVNLVNLGTSELKARPVKTRLPVL